MWYYDFAPVVMKAERPILILAKALEFYPYILYKYLQRFYFLYYVMLDRYFFVVISG